jgi:MoaA/NifB/PqqE/SkfB family radical SAM enzyme
MPDPNGFPRILQIQTTTACGAKCVMCPHSTTSGSWPNGPIDEFLFRDIVRQCRGHDVKRICPYLMADPLCDPRIFDRIAYVHDVLPDVEIEISTTAQTLGPSRHERLLAAPLAELRISSHGISAEDYATLMPGVSYPTAWPNLIAFIENWRATQPYAICIISLYGLLPPDRERAIADFWQEQGIRLERWRVTSRGNQIDLNQFDTAPDPTDWPRARREPPYVCRFARDREWMHILSDGRVTLCCMDYEQQVILGDLSRESMETIWTGPRYQAIRRGIADGDSDTGNPLCGQCEWYVSESVLRARQRQPVAVL